MAQPQSIDWPGIRAAAMVLGVREAARRAAANLPPNEIKRFENRVLKRSEREEWLKEKQLALASPPPLVTNETKEVSSKVINGAESIVSALTEHSNRSRVALARTVTKAVEGYQELDAECLMHESTSKAVRNYGATAASVHNWNADQRPGSPLNLQVLSQNTVISISEK